VHVGTEASSKNNWEHACVWWDDGCTRWRGGNRICASLKLYVFFRHNCQFGTVVFMCLFVVCRIDYHFPVIIYFYMRLWCWAQCFYREHAGIIIRLFSIHSDMLLLLLLLITSFQLRNLLAIYYSNTILNSFLIFHADDCDVCMNVLVIVNGLYIL